MIDQATTVGWDVGGAHLKYAQVDAAGRLLAVRQIPCPLWRGVAQLDSAFAIALASLSSNNCRHAVTMTGELSDVFVDRLQGVQILAERITALLEGELRFFAGPRGLLPAHAVMSAATDIASANWAATGAWLGRIRGDCLLIDIGSTTCDLVRVRAGRVATVGYTDAERLRSGELIYTGVIRTAIAVLANEVPFAGEWQAVVAERFACTGDVYRLTGDISTDMLHRYVHFDAADGGGADLPDCARRLARMLGYDYEQAPLADWQRLAAYFAECQVELILRGLWRVLSRDPAAQELPLVAAGVGRFLAVRLARRLGRDVQDIASLFTGTTELKDYAAVCAPATALACLLRV